VGLRPKKSPKMVIFGINLPQKCIRLSDIYKILPGGSKNRQNGNFWFLPLEKKFWGSIGKLEHRCTTTNLPLCNDTIIVLKIILLHSVSVITNFVIPKRDKKTDRQTKNITLFCVQPARDPGSRPYLAW